ncbi:glycosyltransferase family 4 protein [Amylibacter sp.]|nr:glycosyltransferase family 4 protein [Amylibacter sp.]
MKVLFIFEYLSSFRVDVLNELSKRYEVTVIHSGYRGGQKARLFIEEIVPMRKFGRFRWQYNIRSLSQYDVYVCMFDLGMPTYLRLIFGKRKKVLLYSIGYGSSLLGACLRRSIYHFFGGAIVYSEANAQQLIWTGVSGEKVFSVDNTISISSPIDSNIVRDNILFIGSNKDRKRVNELIHAFHRAVDSIALDISLCLVGDGMSEKYQHLVDSLNLTERVIFSQGVFDDEKIAKIYSKAIAYVAPGHVGLSVLQAMGHGVPIVTSRNRPHGPEFLSITDNYNSFLYKDNNELKNLLIWLCLNKQAVRLKGDKLKELYQSKYSIEKMADRFSEAIEYIRNA